MAVTEFWGEHTIPTEEPVELAIDSLHVWCRKAKDELWIAHRYNQAEALPPELQWSRWALKQKIENIRFVPCFPDLPLVVTPEYAFRLGQGAQVRIFVSVPLWVRLELDQKKAPTILEIPTIPLQRTWFGTFAEGEVCYWSSTRVRRELGGPSKPNVATCPIQITNGSDIELNVEKLALRVGRLSLFGQDNQFWSDEVQIEYRGSNEVSKIMMSGRTPPEASGAQLITAPRNPDKKGFAAKTFTTLKDLTGLDSLF